MGRQAYGVNPKKVDGMTSCENVQEGAQEERKQLPRRRKPMRRQTT